ncbi:MAG: sensor histidine kinase [Rikenellaceae bacterium]|nr:sensor histidine kinase [Rikenellaceae bacterium]
MSVKVKSMSFASLSISAVTALFSFGMIFFFGGGDLVVSVSSALIMGFVIYIVSRYTIWRFVLYRIKPIYQLMFERNVSVSELAGHFEGRDIISNVGSDIAEWAEKKAAEIDRLKDMENYRKEFLGNVSHELRTPLFTLQGYVITLLDGGVDNRDTRVRYLEKANKCIERLIAIVHDLEEISKLEMKVLNLERTQFDIVALARETAEVFNMQQNPNDIVIKVDGVLPIDVFADRRRIEQVFINLMSNSIKYGRKGGVTTVGFVDMFDKVMVEITDNGIGISKENMPRVFERFFRADTVRSQENGGTGLGLAIVKHIIEAHGEKVVVRSQLGEGTTFGFTLKKYL